MTGPGEHVETKSSMFDRIICIVLDGVGVGELPDADEYGDCGSNSLGNTAAAVGSLRMPHMGSLGLGNIIPIEGVPPAEKPEGFFGKLKPLSPGKDSTSGHWELMGCILDSPFPTYPKGFPQDVVRKFESAIGRRVLGNYPASGTEIIQTLGETHVKTGNPILYTSQDSVFQLAAHEEIIPVETLYEMCRQARELLIFPHNVARVIARPFQGRPGNFHRTSGRRDFSLEPPKKTVLDVMGETGHKVIGIGKIYDLFGHRGIGRPIMTKSNREGMDETLDAVKMGEGELIFTNLVDFDMMWGHRNDVRAYAIGLEEFDSFLIELMDALCRSDLLIITSDHGCDPTTKSTDHSREYVPLIVFHQSCSGGDIGLRETYSDVGKTVAENFGIAEGFPGTSFLAEIA
jgi:phosphopentomutase